MIVAETTGRQETTVEEVVVETGKIPVTGPNNNQVSEMHPRLNRQTVHKDALRNNHNVGPHPARVMHQKMFRDQGHRGDPANKEDQTGRNKTGRNNKDLPSSDLLKTGHRNPREIIPRRNQIPKQAHIPAGYKCNIPRVLVVYGSI